MYTKCFITETFHIYCPGCGGTRAFKALIHFNLLESVFYNPIIIYIVADVFFSLITHIIENKKEDICFAKQRMVSSLAVIGLIIVNFIIKNVFLVVFHIDLLGDILR